ncbi:hypothetical protein [Alkalilimnicola ehrlichii]|uniref:Beta-ketoacyl synthase N-terminal domain-containing protein n=1 Tax=Alkalilimnicola ehrlichii TaxID=351052 RepID=A0A3E0WV24_9GAMM|nr:hypothetical protein [Alkalilimnicola ehrlichii]RFA36830.1 hypothetical protein CAL65_09920 [Alkalilimnicola ehrlichii]
MSDYPVILGSGLCTLAGDAPQSALALVETHYNGAAPEPTLTVPAARTEAGTPALTARAGAAEPSLAELMQQLGTEPQEDYSTPGAQLETLTRPFCLGDSPEARITALAARALNALLTTLPPAALAGNVLIHFAVPARDTHRGRHLDAPHLTRTLKQLHPALRNAEVRLQPNTQGVTAQLQTVLDEWPDAHWDTVLFGGADSLLDEPTVLDLIFAERAATTENPDGVSPAKRRPASHSPAPCPRAPTRPSASSPASAASRNR